MNYLCINLLIVFFLGCLIGLSELIARYNDSKYIFRVWQAYAYILLNAIISMAALFLIKYFKNQEVESMLKIEINNIIIAGLGGMMILRSSFFSIKHKDSKVDIGFGTIAQIFLDLIEKKMKNSAASLKIIEMNEIMKGVIFEEAKLELSTICINSIDNFSSEDSKELIDNIEKISIPDLTNTNKVIQLGICISKYCDNAILKNSIKVLGLNKESKMKISKDESDVEGIDFYINKLKKQ